MTSLGTYSYLGTGSITPVEAPEVPPKPELGPVAPVNPQTTARSFFSGFSGYDCRPVRCVNTWLSCLTDPVLAAARAYALTPIKNGKPRFAARDNAPAVAKEWITNAITPVLSQYLSDAVWGVDLAWAGWQNVWAREDGNYVIKRMLACRQELDSGVLTDSITGEMVGVRWEGADLFGHKGFIYTHDKRGWNDYLGNSRLENVVQTIHNWRQANDTSAKLGKKGSGIVFLTGYPPGTSVDASGNVVTRAAQADAFGKNITQAGAAYGSYPLLGALTEEQIATLVNTKPEVLATLLELSLWKFDLKDLGETGPALVAWTAEKRYLDELKCLGYFVPPEAILQGTGGNRAKSDSQGNSGTSMNESVNQGIYTALNQGPIDSMLVLRYGEKARGAVYAVPEPLEDPQAVFDRMILDAMLRGNSWFVDYVSRYYDLDDIMTRNGVSKRDKPIGGPEMESGEPAGNDGAVVDIGFGDDRQKKFDLAEAAGKIGVSHREQLRIAGYDAATANRILGEKALEDAEAMMAGGSGAQSAG